MAIPNRAALLTKTYRVLKKHYQPVAPPPDRSLLEHLLFACCLESSEHSVAESAYSVLVNQFFDWNEIRVSSVRELAEAMHDLTDAPEAAIRLKNSLQSVFESNYAFDLEAFKKQNIGQAVKTLLNYNGTTQFTISYIKQTALGGHSIPVNKGALEALMVIGVISEAEAKKGVVPGLERAISKNKGIEFGSLLHQMGVLLLKNPYGPALRKLLLEIAPDCKDRLPKRSTKKSAEKESEAAEAAPEKKSAPAPEKKKTAAKKKTPTKKKAPPKKKPTTKKKAAKKKVAVKKKASTSKAKPKTKTKEKSSTRRLSKRKPR